MKRILLIRRIARHGFFLSLVLCAGLCAGKTKYYVSAHGSDKNTGTTTSSPWKTITKVNAMSFTSGDNINFQCGDTFYGQLSINQPGVTLGSYGTGAKPVITGGVELTGWTVYSGSIYVAQAPGFVRDVFVNGAQMTVARTPNAGFMTVTSTNGSSSVSSGELTQAAGYWTGGNLHIRTTDWTYETRPITGYSTGTVTVSGSPEFAYAAGWGFYVDNRLAALDAPGEWYCDASTNKVYLYAPGGVNPSTLRVIGSVLDYGVSSSQSSTTVQGLAFWYQASAAIHFAGSATGVKVLANDVVNQWMHGIEFVGGGHSSVTIDGNTVQNVNGRGINCMPNPQSFTITNNTIRSIGLVPGYGSSGFTGMSAIVAQAGAHNTISRNVIDSVGYIGIRHDGSYNMIENNVITNAMLRLCDGGAIYAWGGTGGTFGTTIRNNIVENTPGDNTGVAHQPSVKQGHGIYFDLGCFNMLMEGNTVIHAGDAAVFIQYSDYGIVVRNNIFYECAANYYSATVDLIQDNSMGHGANVFTKNVFFPLNNTSPLFRQQQAVPLSALQSIGTLDSNYYCDPYSKSVQFYINNYSGSWTTATLTLAGWKSQLGQDAHSKGMYTTLTSTDAKRSIFVNKTAAPMTVTLSPMTYRDLDGASVTGAITLQPFSSRLLIKDSVSTTPPAGTLPVELTSFTMNTTSSGTVLNWRTATEVNSFGFDVERKDNAVWTKIGFVSGSGTTNTAHNYSFSDGATKAGGVSYRLKQITVDGSFTYSKEITTNVTTDAKLEDAIPHEFALGQNYPNPFNPATTIKYAVAAPQHVQLVVYDVVGRVVATLVNGQMQPGNYSVQWNAASMPSGVYFYRLDAGDFTSVKKLLLQK